MLPLGQTPRLRHLALALTLLFPAALPATAAPQFRGCLKNGVLTNVTLGASFKCPKGSKLVTWNSEGVAGPSGPAGPTGQQGSKGDVGAAGPTGATGPVGPQGPSNGVVGPVGPMGPQGPAGPPGPAGPSGGPQGPKGDTGAQGPQGVPGETGTAGPAGAKGETGTAGPPGQRGETGTAGAPQLPTAYVATKLSTSLPDGTYTQVVSQTLSAGKYFLFATLNVNGVPNVGASGNNTIWCQVGSSWEWGGSTYGDSRVWAGPDANHETRLSIAMTGVADLATETTLKVFCFNSNFTSGATALLTTFTAIPLSAVVSSSG